MSFIVAIDGPAGTGKGTVTKILSEKLNLVNIDTGAMYRCVTLYFLNKGIDINDEKNIKESLENIDIELRNENGNQIVFLNGQDVSEEIRSKRVSEIVSIVSGIKQIRLYMSDLQRKLGEKQDSILEGRDIGTCVFPDADVKIYLDADVEERARRRYNQNKEKNIEMSYEDVLKNIIERDKNDKERKFGALKKAEDAILIDTTHLTIDEVVEKICDIITIRSAKFRRGLIVFFSKCSKEK